MADFSRGGTTAGLVIGADGFSFRGPASSDWDVALSRELEVNLDINAGAADIDLDLLELRVVELDIAVGASGCPRRGTFPAVHIGTGKLAQIYPVHSDPGVRFETPLPDDRDEPQS